MVIPGLLDGGSDAAVRATKQNAVIVTGGDTEVVVSGNGCEINAGSTIFKVSDSGVNIKGNVTVAGDIKVGSVSFKNHTHTDSTGGKTQKPE